MHLPCFHLRARDILVGEPKPHLVYKLVSNCATDTTYLTSPYIKALKFAMLAFAYRISHAGRAGCAICVLVMFCIARIIYTATLIYGPHVASVRPSVRQARLGQLEPVDNYQSLPPLVLSQRLVRSFVRRMCVDIMKLLC